MCNKINYLQKAACVYLIRERYEIRLWQKVVLDGVKMSIRRASHALGKLKIYELYGVSIYCTYIVTNAQ